MRYVATTGMSTSSPHAWHVRDYGADGHTVPSVEVPGSRRKHHHQAVKLANKLNKEWEEIAPPMEET